MLQWSAEAKRCGNGPIPRSQRSTALPKPVFAFCPPPGWGCQSSSIVLPMPLVQGHNFEDPSHLAPVAPVSLHLRVQLKPVSKSKVLPPSGPSQSPCLPSTQFKVSSVPPPLRCCKDLGKVLRRDIDTNRRDRPKNSTKWRFPSCVSQISTPDLSARDQAAC